MHLLVDIVRQLPFDLRQILRSFARRPVLVAVSVLSLALGIGANAALFSVADAVLFSAPPYPEPERVVRLWETFQAPGGTRWTGSVSPLNLFDWRRRAQYFDGLGAYSAISVNLTSGGVPERALSVRVESDVFDLLGVSAARGRVLLPEDAVGDGRVVVLSDHLWRARYGGDPALVGGTIDLGGAAYQVVGVMPADFEFPPRQVGGTRPPVDLWQPLIFEPRHYEDKNRGNHWLEVVGRLSAGTDLATASAEMEAIAARMAEEYPDNQTNRSVLVKTLQDSLVGDARPVLYALWGAVAFVLLIASGNVAHLLLARAARRRQELALRSALGAGGSRLAVLVLLEALVLAAGGGVLGLALGGWAVKRLAALPGSTLPAGTEVSLDLRVFGYALAAGLVAALLAGAVPAWRASRVDLRSALGTARGALGHRDHLRGLLVVAEVALALVVTLGAALMVRSLLALGDVDSGIDTEQVLSLRVPVPKERYDEEALPGIYSRMQDGVAQLPGIESAGWINLLPLTDWGWNGKVAVEGQDPPDDDDPWVEFRVIEGEYFRTLGIPLVSGRTFRLGDDSESASVVIINQTLARLYWGEGDPVGARVSFGDVPEDDEGWQRVIGVVGDVRNAGLQEATHPEIYFPMAQQPLHDMSLVVRTRVTPEAMTEEIRHAVLAVDPLQPIYRVRTMGDVVSEHLAGRSFDTLLLSAFAGLALLLAVVGVYSVMSHDVSLRRCEVGLRMALGADRGGVVRLFLGRGLRLAAMGAVLGGLVATLATRLLENRLYGVEATDPATYGAGAVLLVLVAAAACALPALRAAGVQPTEALRDE